MVGNQPPNLASVDRYCPLCGGLYAGGNRVDQILQKSKPNVLPKPQVTAAGESLDGCLLVVSPVVWFSAATL
jgi:hypothetical protein